MSTKTTFKRIALVTVAALGFGVMSVAPSNAVVNADSLTLSAATATQTTGETQTATSAVATLTFLPTAKGDSMTVTASLVSGPAGNTALPYLSVTESASAGSDSATALVLGAKTEPNNGATSAAMAASAVTTAKFAVYLGTDSRTAPTVAGTYVVKLTPALKSSTTGGGNATAQTLTITVSKAAADDTVNTSATSILTKGETTTSVANGTAPTIDDIVTCSSTAPTASTAAACATIKVTTKNASALAVTGESFTATISGAGTLGSAAGSSGADITTPNPVGRAITVQNGHFVQIWADGTSGVGTVTISSSAGLVLATEKVTFFGTATSIVATSQATVLNVGTNDGLGETLDRPIKVVLKDAAGTSVSGATLYVTSETTSIVSNSYSTCTTYDADEAAYFCTLTGVAAGKTKITVGTKSSATATTGINATAVEVRVGTTIASSVKVTLDKASYAPGEKATLTVALLDADGLAVADGDYAGIFATGGITTDFVLGSGSETTTATAVESSSGGDVVAGTRAYTLYMPIISGDITFSWTTGGTAVTGTAPTAENGLAVANQAVKGSLKATVSNPATDAAAAAAEEATAAANDATDAALSAAEAAEAATAMAQEAVDAVAELSSQVTALISALRAQITSLTNLVI